jgi:AmmeMemoRadiSam system protein A
VLEGRRAVIAASSDLSHYPDAATAVDVDTQVMQAVADRDPAAVSQVIGNLEQRGLPGLSTCACGEGAMLAMLHAATQLGANHVAVLERVHSGQTVMGESNRVVGYGAAVVARRGRAGRDVTVLLPPVATEATVLSPAQQQILLRHARRTIAQFLTTGTAPLARDPDPRLSCRQGAFVTLKDPAGRLRGCIGHLASDRALGEVVGAMALQAAMADRRFRPVTPGELTGLRLEVSVLTPARRVAGPEAIRPGIDGVIVQKGDRQAVFLPQVATEEGWDRDTLLTRLCRKAGLDGSAWRRPGCTFLTFQAQVFRED